MKTVTEFPHEIVEEENVFIPVTDGLHLSARIWRPKGSEEAPVPAVLEYIPYRKRFGTAVRDERTHPYLAGHGYACIRLDIRGSGESDGVLTDEYLQSELDDGVAALHWIADQPWCDGNIGMMGISWGGFNGLQIAAMQPEPLKAVVTMSSTDDRYSDDIHHMGGCLLGDNLSWSSVMFSYNTMPPDPALVGDRWRDMWLERLDGSGLWLKTWLQHQRRDAYWRHGSVREDYSAIKVPVYAISGWADGYTNSVFRLMENLDVPRKGLVGPWGHIYPHFGRPGPAIDFLSELLRWWDRWLKGIDTGIEDDPMICAWMQDSAPPNPEYDYRPGRWVGEDDWPAPRVTPQRFVIAEGRTLRPEGERPSHKEGQVELDVQSPVTLGLHSGKWCSYANGPDLADDQRSDDGGALVFQTEPLEEDIELLGRPEVELELASDRPVAMVAVRLSDMRPDHQVTRITYGMQNLTHHESREDPEELEPGRFYRVRVPLCYIAQRVPKGHRVRLSVSTVYWPLAWTPPEPVRLTIRTEKSTLTLPCRAAVAEETIPDFGTPVQSPGPALTTVQPPEHEWLIRQDLGRRWTELYVTDDRGVMRLDDIGLTVGAHAVESYGARPGDFTSATGETEWIRTLERDDWRIETRTRTRLTSDRENFYLTAELDAWEGDARVRSLSWNETIPRDML
ncbi:CocE/NonD family hydrolase [Psychromarinibacter sp. C21-152]|uniref:CocE/NonD family hydrolase n=1 Tax=Psychromarinibacter sediminicola TaxID=3033385 RepID=A0AAE3T8S8_9RHOB|nr:CocE/NonD family hydrolase [Psychromarinibacter sediminicola]MDF0601567.1 CocE/NonD family hydrolase [Psychromarinibacter sediminicola]